MKEPASSSIIRLLKSNLAAIILLSVGIILILSTPYIPSGIFRFLYSQARLGYPEIRFEAVIPSVLTAGIMLSLCGIALFHKSKKN